MTPAAVLASPEKPSDKWVRERLFRIWTALDRLEPERKLLEKHCGGRGLSVGCPVCLRRWPT